ncbi:hypothetical protein F4775DRAFT_602748 [Biscogniauxia sp. FL1348]|nr:hypothetical protein F4775DRAFT_602748 [Biscogniauxia sp. FL1348]
MRSPKTANTGGLLERSRRSWRDRDTDRLSAVPAAKNYARSRTGIPTGPASKPSNLHCSACRLDHPASLFTTTQQQASPSSRTCKGHETLVVSWAPIASCLSKARTQARELKAPRARGRGQMRRPVSHPRASRQGGGAGAGQVAADPAPAPWASTGGHSAASASPPVPTRHRHSAAAFPPPSSSLRARVDVDDGGGAAPPLPMAMAWVPVLVSPGRLCEPRWLRGAVVWPGREDGGCGIGDG